MKNLTPSQFQQLQLRRTVPAKPDAAKKPVKSRKLAVEDREDTAQQAFVKWADVAIVDPCRYWFVPNGLGKLGHYMKTWATKMGLKPGVSDIHVMWPGGYGVIEFKSKTGDLTGEQTRFLGNVKDCKHRYGVARSLDDAIALLNAWGVPHRDANARSAA